MGRAELYQKPIRVALGLVLASYALGLCPPKWISYRNELCFYIPAGPALSWKEAHVFCQDQKAELVIIKDYSKQMFLRDHTDGVRGPSLQYWIGLAWQEASAQLVWMDGTPISQSWYSNWLQGHPKKGRCVQLVGFYAGQWRDWDCRANNSFICEMPAKDAFPGSVRKVRFRSHCYAFHFPSFREMRSWREAQSFCQESGENLASVHNEEENTFLSYAFLEDGWNMWIGLRFGTRWKWSDSSSPAYFRWHPEEAPSKVLGQCVVLSFQPEDAASHGTWKTRPCNARPPSEATGFICQHRYDFCGPPEPVRFPLPGGMGRHATVDVVFTLPAYSTCSLSVTGLHPNATPLQIRLESDATHLKGNIAAKLGSRSVLKNFPHMPFSPGLNTWSFITYPDSIASFFNHQEHFRMSDAQGVSFAQLSSVQITGVTVANASLESLFSSDLHFPGESSLQLENAISCYLSNFTLGLWFRSSHAGSHKMCLVSYSLKWRLPDFALFLLSPSGLEFHIKGATMFRGIRSSLLDGTWHHVAVSVSSALGALPFEVFIDGENWEPQYAQFTSFLQKGIPLGGTLSVGHLEVNSRGTSFYMGDLSEVNLWDRAIPEVSVKQLAASRTKWKFPGNVVSWNQLVEESTGTVQISTPSEDPVAAFVWFGLLRLRWKHSVLLCTDQQRFWVYLEPVQKSCHQRAFWGLQLNGRLRNVADPPACLLVSPDGVSLSISLDCSPDAKSSFRLLPDQRLQNLFSGFCLFQEVISTRLYLGKCTPQALYFDLDRDVHCPRTSSWRSRKDKCLVFMLNVALEWSQALKFCQRFHGGSLFTINSPEDLIWLQEELQVSVWTGLHSTGRNQWSWADGTPFNKALQRFIFSQGPYSDQICMLILTSGFLKAELCHRPHRWICQVPQKSDSYMTFPEKSFYGAFSVDLSFSSLQLAKRQCTALGKGCNMVVSTETGHRLALGSHLVSLEEPINDPSAVVHVKLGCSPGYSGQDCQAMCPRCEPSMSCNPLTGLCEGFLYYKEALATYISLKCLPLGAWIFEDRSCVSSERYGSHEEAELACQRYLGAEVWKIPAGFPHGQRRGVESNSLPWACRRPEDVELPSFREKLLISLQGSTLPQRRPSLQEARDACYLHKEHCTGVLSLHNAFYMVAGTVLVDSPGSGATLYVKAACSPGFCGDWCRKRCSLCLPNHFYNPLTGQCDGHLSCVRRFSPSCLQGLVNSRCPRHPGWWFWNEHCYYVEEHSRKDWQGAKEACQAYGENIGLLSLNSGKEKAWVRDMVLTGSWTGLNDLDGDGTWMWERGQAVNLTSPWLADVQLPTGECLEIRGQGEQNLAASSCSELKPWVCKGTWGWIEWIQVGSSRPTFLSASAPWSPCPTEAGWTPWNGSCYYWDPSSVSKWHAARQACQRFRKTELLYLTSSQEKDWVLSQFTGSFWTGLNDLKEESVFRWTTKEPLAQELAQYLQDDLANGGQKDCVWFDTATGLLRDTSCKEERPFLCKCSEATDWFDKQPGRGMAGDPSFQFPSAGSLEEAKQGCLQERSVCSAVLQTGTGFYLISNLSEIISKPDSELHVLTICAEGFSGPHCHKNLTRTPRPACDCSGKFQTTAKKVCGIPVQECVDDCKRSTTQRDCSLCLPICTEASMSNLDPEELALITMIQFKVSNALSLTAEDEGDRGNSSKIIYDSRYP